MDFLEAYTKMCGKIFWDSLLKFKGLAGVGEYAGDDFMGPTSQELELGPKIVTMSTKSRAANSWNFTPIFEPLPTLTKRGGYMVRFVLKQGIEWYKIFGYMVTLTQDIAKK